MCFQAWKRNTLHKFNNCEQAEHFHTYLYGNDFIRIRLFIYIQIYVYDVNLIVILTSITTYVWRTYFGFLFLRLMIHRRNVAKVIVTNDTSFELAYDNRHMFITSELHDNFQLGLKFQPGLLTKYLKNRARNYMKVSGRLTQLKKFHVITRKNFGPG